MSDSAAKQGLRNGEGEEPPAEAQPTSAVNAFKRWAPPVLLGAAGISVVVHMVMGVMAALILVGGGGQAGGAGEGSGGDTVGVAVMTEAELGSVMQAAGLQSDTPAVAEAPVAKLPGSEVEIQISEAGIGGSDVGALGEGSGKLTSGMGAGDISGGPGLGGTGGGGGAASFFGVEARGTRFAYICDISGSMDQGIGVGEFRRIDILKNELGKSLAALLENAYFSVMLFSTGAVPLGGKAEWTSANDTGKAWAKRTVPLITSEGGTVPLPAFKLVFKLRPRPDAIYFMTDGEFDESVASEIARENMDWKIPIHCISFISREGEKQMRKIAEQSGGTYTHVPGPSN